MHHHVFRAVREDSSMALNNVWSYFSIVIHLLSENMFVDTNVALFDHMALWTISNEACRINWCKYASSSSPGPAGTISASYRGSDFPIMAKMTTILDGWNFERWSYPKWTKWEVFSGNLRRHRDWFMCLTYLHCGDTFEMRWKMHVCTVQWRNISRDTRYSEGGNYYRWRENCGRQQKTALSISR